MYFHSMKDFFVFFGEMYRYSKMAASDSDVMHNGWLLKLNSDSNFTIMLQW